MELLAKVVICAIVIVVIVFVGYYVATSNLLMAQPVTSQQAAALVRTDLLDLYPNSNITLTEVVPSSYSGSWHIEAAVISNATSPCPSYSILSFDYPKFGFVSTKKNIYVQNCTPMNYSVGNLVPNPQVATAIAYGLSSMKAYLSMYGMPNVTAITAFSNNAYIINYSTRRSSNYIVAILSQKNGSVLSVRSGSK
jgi:hypothetical protein